MCLSTKRFVLPVCKLGSLPVYLSTTRVIANVFICKKGVYFQCVFLQQRWYCLCGSKAYYQWCVYLQQGLYCQCVNKAYRQCIYLQQGLYCQCVNSSHCQCVYLLQGLLPVVCLSAQQGVVLPSVFFYNKAYCQCVYLQKGVLPVCFCTTILVLPVC